MTSIHGIILLAVEKSAPMDLADVLLDGRLSLSRCSLEDHEGLRSLEVIVEQEQCGAGPGFTMRVVVANGALALQCNFYPVINAR